MKVLIADDHPIFRKGLKAVIISEFADVTVLEAEDGIQAKELIINEEPLITILDIDMPEMDGLQVCREIRGKEIATRIIMLTMHKDEVIFSAAMDSGADAYLIKDNSGREVKECILQVMIGRHFVSEEMKKHLAQFSQFRKQKGSLEKLLNTLTQTELKVLKLVNNNLSSREVADQLFVTTKSVENYRSRVCKKLSLEGGNNALIRWVLENKDLLDRIDEFKVR